VANLNPGRYVAAGSSIIQAASFSGCPQRARPTVTRGRPRSSHRVMRGHCGPPGPPPVRVGPGPVRSNWQLRKERLNHTPGGPRSRALLNHDSDPQAPVNVSDSDLPASDYDTRAPGRAVTVTVATVTVAVGDRHAGYN
jgi:hypothetical protein